MSTKSPHSLARNPDKYRDKVILAPMVRIGTLPSRILALDYGADLVYSEEIIDFKLLRCTRHINNVLGTIDFISDDQVVVFRTCEREKEKVILQLGTSDPGRALQAAKIVEHDVSGIDINMGCPKDFSLKGGMGAALLTQPQKVKDILTTLVCNLSIPVTCKIRILPNIEDTLSLIKLIESTGVSAIAVHARTKEERPRHANRNEVIRKIKEVIKTIPIIANGGSGEINSYEDIAKFREKTSADSVMLARASEANPSIFRREGMLDLDTVITEFLKYSIIFDNHVQNAKYCIQHMLQSLQATEKGQRLLASYEMIDIISIWELNTFYQDILDKRKTLPSSASGYSLKDERCFKKFKYNDDDNFLDNPVTDKKEDSKENKKFEGEKVIESCIVFKRQIFETPNLPKNILHNYLKTKFPNDKALYETISVDKKFVCSLRIGSGLTFRSTFLSKNKKSAEQATALLAALHFNLWKRDDVKDCLLE